ncbi:Proteasome subunit beta type-4 [Datura stramonium]|uniref:Proteasome subunit beta n=1 Tax=Datura stramonium TaxID=4076 RepID=A0ABS8THR8_DATST|nr:Proteasome subunit beta type-4 [Datura stramonium]
MRFTEKRGKRCTLLENDVEVLKMGRCKRFRLLNRLLGIGREQHGLSLYIELSSWYEGMVPFPCFKCKDKMIQYPYVTGTSVIGIKYKDGVLLAADMGGSYGSTIRYKSVERLKSVGKHSLLGASGEISDFQEILQYLDELILYDNMWDDGNSLGPKEVHNYLTRVMYNRRNKFNPLWNSLVLGGVKNGQKYLGTVSMIGVHYEDNHVATGFGNHLAKPIIRDEWREDLSYEEGVKLLEKCMRVLLYRDRSAVNKLQIAKITEEGVTISQPYSLKTFWSFSAFENPSAGAVGSW